MAFASRGRTGTLLPAMQRDRDSKLVSREAPVWISVMDAHGSTGAWDSASVETLASVADPMELDGIVAQVDNEYVIKAHELKRF